MTSQARRDWGLQLAIASGSCNALRVFGLRDAFRFRAASSRCREALEVDRLWPALTFLATGGIQRGPQQASWNRPTADDWAAVYEHVMQFCLKEAAVQMRLELGGLEADVAAQYGSSDMLQFGLVHEARTGVVAYLHLGLNDDFQSPTVSEAPEECDWSMAPAGFKEQLLASTSLRALLRHKGRDVVLADVPNIDVDDPTGDVWPEAQIRLFGGNTLSTHSAQALCCEFALHLKLQIPSSTFAHVLFPHMELLRQDSLQVARVLPSDLHNVGLPSVRLLGEFWKSEGISNYAEHYDTEDDYDALAYRQSTFKFSAELDLAPITLLLRDTPESILYKAGADTLRDSCLRFDMPLQEPHDVHWDTWQRPDRVSIWALDSTGSTRFQLHGLTLMWVAGDQTDRLCDNIAAPESSSRMVAQMGLNGILGFNMKTKRLSLVRRNTVLDD
eukprot:TRINITY_DN123359_c0_g1_i1.p1 TRINITY_DN123359_c0_g1~~TRINITY_DN123359_c0_g1_i1.p1  ORF type:complete len:444 (-),score=36.05 TRINITY_DN123359_c0_g1_i1:25-1356(-)